MFDIGFSELMLIGIVALLVVGPERLPQVARTVGRWVSRAQRFVRGARSQFMSELESGDLKKIIGDQRDQISELKGLVDETRTELRNSAKVLEQKTRDSLDEGEKAMTEAKSRLASGTLATPVNANDETETVVEQPMPAESHLDEAGTLFESSDDEDDPNAGQHLAGDDPGAVSDESVYQASGSTADSETTQPEPGS